MNQEVWKTIPCWDGYEISNRGNVRSWLVSGHDGKRSKFPKLRKLQLTKDGRFTIDLHKPKSAGGKYERWLVHRLVAMNFVEGDQNLEVAHLDGDPKNNNANNLAWVTPKENAAHKFDHGTQPLGSKHHNSKLNEAAVRAIRKLKHEHELRNYQIADLFGVQTSTISAIIREENWSWLK